MELRQLKQSEIKPLREKLYKEQDGICPILKQKININDATLDHQHKRKGDPIGIDGGGLIRGVIHYLANVIEGKITNTYKRYGLHKFISLPDLLRNLADYLEQENLPYIHPSEKAKEKRLKKTSYNLLKKTYTGKAKFPPYPKSGKMTAPLKRLFERFDILPAFYK